MKSKTLQQEHLLNGSIVIIMENASENSGVTYSCYIVPKQNSILPEIVLQNSTLEDCETAFAETLENDLCDIN